MVDKEEKETTEKLSFKTGDELSQFLMDLQGQMGNMQEMIDKLAPVEEEGKEEVVKDEPTAEPSEEEVNEIDKLLQSE